MQHLQACAGAACVKMAEAAAASPGELTLIATGPMTNVALACLVDPSFPGHVGTLHAMGGAEGKGNITPYAEWNFHCDPEAAQVVGSATAMNLSAAGSGSSRIADSRVCVWKTREATPRTGP